MGHTGLSNVKNANMDLLLKKLTIRYVNFFRTEVGALLLLGRDRKILILSPAISKFNSPASVTNELKFHGVEGAKKCSLCDIYFQEGRSQGHHNKKYH